MDATTTLTRPHEGLMTWLVERGVSHVVHDHEEADTARGVASAEGVDPHTFAKVVGVATDDGRQALLVVEATDQIDLRKARQALDAHDVRLLSEPELAVLAPDCEIGALPAVGALVGRPMIVDLAIRDAGEISFNAGSHRMSVRVDRAAWERASEAHYADIARDADRYPAWAR